MPTPSPQVVTFLQNNKEGNEFYTSLLEQYEDRNFLSEKQIACVERALDKEPLKVPSADVLPRGRYAIDNADGVPTFYNVWRGDRNTDYVVLKVVHGGEESEIPFGKGAVTILEKIVEYGAGRAAVRYGHEIGCCSRCNAQLTHPISRALGIGPICGGHFYGEEFKSVVHGARQMLRESGIDPDAEISLDVDVPRYDVEGDFEPDHSDEGGDKWEIEAEMLDDLERKRKGRASYTPRPFDLSNVPAGMDDVYGSLVDHRPLDNMTSDELAAVIARAQDILNARNEERKASEQNTSFLSR